MSRRPQIVFLGMITKIPVPGEVWQNLHYLLGFERLGCDVYYVEAHARTPTALMKDSEDDSSLLAARFLDRLMRGFGLDDRWAFHALDVDGRCYGFGEERLRRLYREADLIVNFHGGTVPLPEHVESERLVLLQTDPVQLELELHDRQPWSLEFLAAHGAVATYALNHRGPDCLVPLPDDADWYRLPPPVVVDLWEPYANGPGDAFTTVGNFRQWRDMEYRGEVYTWSKHPEFLKVIDLPRRTGLPLELALASYEEADLRLLTEHGWRVRPAAEVSGDLDDYRRYLAGSRGEFTVAKDQNVRLRSGWFSDRSAAYLACGRPVITQDTGFGSFLPTGEGLFAFTTVDEAAAALEEVSADYERHSAAAKDLAREYLEAERVLPGLLEHFGVELPVRSRVPALVGAAVAAEPPGPPQPPSLVERVAELRALVPVKERLGGGSRYYHRMVERLRELVDDVLPTDAAVLVVSKGDDELLRLGGRPTGHFPQTEAGAYAGHHPADSGTAITQIETLRDAGAEYLVFPDTSRWWLDFYGELGASLVGSGALVADRPDVGLVYALTLEAAGRARPQQQQRDAESLLPGAVPEGDDVAVRLDLVDLLCRLGRVDEAVAEVSAGLELTPGEPRLFAARMRCEDARGNRALAARYAEQAAALMGDDYQGNLELARWAWDAGRFELAEERLGVVIGAHPHDGVAADELIRLYCARLDGASPPDEAVVQRLVERLSTLQAQHRLTLEPLVLAAERLAELHRYEQAETALRAGLALADGGEPALRELVSRLLRTAAVTPPFTDRRALAALLTQAGNARLAQNDPFGAQACWRLARHAQPEASGAAAFNLAFAEIARGDPVETLVQLRTVTRIYEEEGGQICWPTIRNRPWPHGTLPDPGVFEVLKPRGAAWPRITVVTPSFNQAEFVEETLLSVINQGYPDVEYIVVDGGSTDGSFDILRRYEPLLAHLIVEPDGGQADAINKGLRLATGDLVLWVNSDDMLGPGALFAAAATHLSTGADLVAGFCCEHERRRFRLVNRPAVTETTFNPECLGDLFEYWLKGHFFYQPEVAFTRALLERIGPLREDLRYTMDYEFWLRAASAGASVAVVPWPVGLFRKHEAQKTSDLDAAIIEQGAARDGHIVPGPRYDRALEISTRLRSAVAASPIRVEVVTARAGKIFSADMARELAERLGPEGLDVSFGDHVELDRARRADLVLALLHLQREHEDLRRLREGGSPVPVVGWTWDNHHHTFENHRAAADVDLLLPGHAFASAYLRTDRYLLGEALPLCVTQWTAAEAERFFAEHGCGPRSDELYGGFVRYAFAEARNRLVEELREAGFDGVYLLDESALEPYFGLAPDERFAQWAGYKASLCLPLRGDLSQRFFDALLSGQVPIVAPDVHDLDAVVPRRLQRELPVIRCADYSVAAVRKATERALAAFDAGGAEGALRRHRYALENHMFVHRVRAALESVRRAAADE